VGTGDPDSGVRGAFDEWVSYGQPHYEDVGRAFGRAFAVVPGWRESVGMAMAEAQVAGLCVVYRHGDLLRPMLCRGAAVRYDDNDPSSLAAALVKARRRHARRIARHGRKRFDFARVVERTRRAIEL
jgi:hypothetical protein